MESDRPSALDANAFFSRPTPVVPLPRALVLSLEPDSMPPPDSVSSYRTETPSTAPPRGSTAAPAPAEPVPPPAPQPPSDATDRASIEGSRPSAEIEQPFWDQPPAYSIPPVHAPSEPAPRLPPSSARRILAKALFVAVMVPVLLVLAHALSLQYGIEWLDMRELYARAVELIHLARAR